MKLIILNVGNFNGGKIMDNFEAKVNEVKKEMREMGFYGVKVGEWGIETYLNKKNLRKVLQSIGIYGIPDELIQDEFIKIVFKYGEARMNVVLKCAGSKKLWHSVFELLRAWIILKEKEIDDEVAENAKSDFFDF